MTSVKSKPGLRKHYNEAPAEVREYFPHLIGLLDAFPLHVGLAYVFSRVELAQNMTVYCGTVKRHRCDASLARRAVNAHHMTRKDFGEKYEAIFERPPSTGALASIATAEAIRDKVMHGKETTDKEVRHAIASVLDYARQLNSDVDAMAGFRPFADLRGFKGAGKSLDPSTTRWVLKGMGFRIA